MFLFFWVLQFASIFFNFSESHQKVDLFPASHSHYNL